jgi:predicted nuclease of restriction endonuclease-like (RecB) superfamily
MGPETLPRDYARLLRELKNRIQSARTRAVLSVNREMIALYWDIGRRVVERQRKGGWGTGVIERLSRDIQAAFPGVRGYSRQNIQHMRAFYQAWPQLEAILGLSALEAIPAICPQPVGILGITYKNITELPWGHNLVLIERLREPDVRLWYANQAVQHGWSRPVLQHQVDSRLHLLRRPGDGPSIGIILCQVKNKVVAEYALSDMARPIGVSSYRLTKALPEGLSKELPTTKELEERLRLE